MSKKSIYLLLIFILFINCNGTIIKGAEVQTQQTVSSNQAIVSTSTVGDDLFLFVRSPKGTLENVTYQIGTSLCKNTKAEPISQLDVAMKTLVLVDNSFSISQANRSKTKEMLLELIAEKKDNELVRIATFNNQVHYLTDYLSDYTELKKAIQSMQYCDQETYLTDVLYTLLDNDFADAQEDYNRIIVISDGVDNKALGYTKEELYAKLDEKSIPIYTFGCSDGTNNEELKNLFAVSRMSQAKYYLMDEMKDMAVPVQEMAEDRKIIRLRVLPDADLMDGSIKNSKLTFTEDGQEYSLTADVLMPFKVKEEAPTPTVTAPPIVSETPEVPEVTKEEQDYTYIIYIVAAGVVIVIIAAVIFAFMKKRKNQRAFETIAAEDPPACEEEDFEEPTEVAVEEADMTCRIWNEPLRKTLVLTDINAPAKTFQVPLLDNVIIGRSSKHANLVIDYDKSVSAKHCEIEMRPGNKVFIIDLESSNGTFVNGNRVLTETEISSGVVIKLGRVEFKLEIR